MGREIFVDAGAWIALANDKDTHHQAAKAAYPRLLKEYRKLLTTNLVVAEAYVNLRMTLGHHPAMSFLDSLRQSPRIQKVCSTLELEQEAEQILRQYADQDFSFADAVSFVLMQQRGIGEAFAFDQHFATAGFILVPAQG
jgi:predicted nucleic acid-binding protein